MQRRSAVCGGVVADGDEGGEDVGIAVPDPVQHVEALAFLVVAELVVGVRVEVLLVVLHSAHVAAV